MTKRHVARIEFYMTVDTAADVRRLRTAARAAFEEVKQRFRLGLSESPTIRESLPAYLKYLKTERRAAPATLKSTRRRLERFAQDLFHAGDGPVENITHAALAEWKINRLSEDGSAGKYVASKTVAPATVNNDLGVLRAFAQWAARRGDCALDAPALSVERVREKGKPRNRFAPRTISQEEYRAILKRIRKRAPHVALVLEAMLLFGARPEALFRMTWGDVTWPRGAAPGSVRLPALKGGIREEIPVPAGSRREEVLQEALSLLHRYHRGRGTKASAVFVTKRGGTRAKQRRGLRRGWTSTKYAHTLAHVVKACKIRQRFTAYVIRHSAITWLVKVGVPLVVIQHYAKHLNVSTQFVYQWTTGAEARPAYDILDAFAGGISIHTETDKKVERLEVHRILEKAMSGVDLGQSV